MPHCQATAVIGAEPIWGKAALKSGGGAIAVPLPHAGYGPATHYKAHYKLTPLQILLVYTEVCKNFTKPFCIII